MKAGILRNVIRVALTGISAAACSQALAQAAPPAVGTAAQARESDTMLGDIIVTARKRAESLQKVPVAITAITTEQLREKQIKSPYDLSFAAPGLNVRSGGGTREQPDYFLRGQGNTFSGNASVVTYFNDVPLGSIRQNINNAVQNLQIYDLASVQVLKGPQGTLFGKSSTGGAVLFSPVKPSYEFGGFLDAQFGNYDMRELQGAINVPVIDDVLAIRLSGNIVRRDGFTRSVTTGQRQDERHREGLRLGITFQPTDWLTSYTLLQHVNVHEVPSSGIISDYNPNFPLFNTTPGVGVGFFSVAGLCAAISAPAAVPGCITTRVGRINALKAELATELARVQNGGSKRQNRTVMRDIQNFRVQTITNTTSIDIGEVPVIGDVSFRNVFSTLRVLKNNVIREFGVSAAPHGLVINQYDILGTYPNQTIAPSDEAQKTDFLDDFTEEFQVQGKIDGKHSWVAGYFINKSKSDDIGIPPIFGSFNNAFTVPLDVKNFLFPSTVVRSRQAELGYFGQFTADLSPLTEGLHFTAGYRWSKDYNKRRNGTLQLTPTGAVIVGTPVDQKTFRESAPSYTFAVDYQVTDKLLVYLTHRRGFKPGGINSTSALSNVPGIKSIFAPEKLLDIEGGFKLDYEIGGIRARTNVAAYHSWYTNIQRTETIIIPPSQGGGQTTQTNNIAAAEISGLEIENNFRLVGGLSGFINYAYTDAGYTRYPGTTTDNAGVVHLNKDAPYVGTPKHQVTLGARYELPLDASIGTIAISGDYYRQSAIWLDDNALQESKPLGRQKGYGEVNLRADWNNILGSPVDLAVYVRNLTKNLRLAGFGNNIASLGYTFSTYNEPRMFGMQMRVRFGADAK